MERDAGWQAPGERRGVGACNGGAGRARHRRQGRPDAPPHRRAARRRARAARRRARRRQDAAGAHARGCARSRASGASSARPTCCRATSPARSCSTRDPGSSSSAPGRCSPTSSSPTRSTAPRRAPSRRSWRPCRSAASPSTASRTRCRTPSSSWPRRTPWSRRDVPAAGGAGRPVPALPAHRVPGGGRRGAHARALPRRPIRSPRCARPSTRTTCAPRGGGAQRARLRDVAGYVVALARATRESPLVRLGASPRASLALQRAAQAAAALDGRDFVVPDDVQELARAGARAPAAARPRRVRRRGRSGRGRPRRGRAATCPCRRRPRRSGRAGA